MRVPEAGAGTIVAVAAGTLHYSSGNLAAAQVPAAGDCIVEALVLVLAETARKRMRQGDSTASVVMIGALQMLRDKASGPPVLASGASHIAPRSGQRAPLKHV